MTRSDRHGFVFLGNFPCDMAFVATGRCDVVLVQLARVFGCELGDRGSIPCSVVIRIAIFGTVVF